MPRKCGNAACFETFGDLLPLLIRQNAAVRSGDVEIVFECLLTAAAASADGRCSLVLRLRRTCRRKHNDGDQTQKNLFHKFVLLLPIKIFVLPCIENPGSKTPPSLAVRVSGSRRFLSRPCHLPSESLSKPSDRPRNEQARLCRLSNTPPFERETSRPSSAIESGRSVCVWG